MSFTSMYSAFSFTDSRSWALCPGEGKDKGKRVSGKYKWLLGMPAQVLCRPLAIVTEIHIVRALHRAEYHSLQRQELRIRHVVLTRSSTKEKKVPQSWFVTPKLGSIFVTC